MFERWRDAEANVLYMGECLISVKSGKMAGQMGGLLHVTAQKRAASDLSPSYRHMHIEVLSHYPV